MPIAPLNDIDLLWIALEIGRQSQQNGNLPFGCLLADEAGNVLERGENTVITSNDSIAHCEINLVHQLAGKYEAVFLNSCTLYAGTEPCPMCTAAIFWSGIGRVVYALSKQGYHEVVGTDNPAWIFHMPVKELLGYGGRKILVAGPLLEEEGKQFYKDLPV
ncbi:MAG: nucleoside deaminase [Chitinophagaceae bacterium]